METWRRHGFADEVPSRPTRAAKLRCSAVLTPPYSWCVRHPQKTRGMNFYLDGNTSIPTLAKKLQTIGLNVVIHHSALNSYSCLKSSGFNQSQMIGGNTAVDYQMHLVAFGVKNFLGSLWILNDTQAIGQKEYIQLLLLLLLEGFLAQCPAVARSQVC